MRIINKKALHNYHILEHLEAGIVLSGAEVKSIRNGRMDLGESYVKILDDEAFLVNSNIPKYNQASINNLLNVLKVNFNLAPILKVKKRGEYVLNFSVEETKKLVQIIKPFVISSMKYKILFSSLL